MDEINELEEKRRKADQEHEYCTFNNNVFKVTIIIAEKSTPLKILYIFATISYVEDEGKLGLFRV